MTTPPRGILFATSLIDSPFCWILGAAIAISGAPRATIGQVTPLSQTRLVGAIPVFQEPGLYSQSDNGNCFTDHGTYFCSQDSDIQAGRVDFLLSSSATGYNCGEYYSYLEYVFHVPTGGIYYSLSGGLDAYVDPQMLSSNYLAVGSVGIYVENGPMVADSILTVHGLPSDPPLHLPFQLSGFLPSGNYFFNCLARAWPGLHAPVLDARAEAHGHLVFTASPCSLPTITTQPTDVAACTIGMESFDVIVECGGPFTYQWQWSDGIECGWNDVHPSAIGNLGNVCIGNGGSGGSIGDFSATGIQSPTLTVTVEGLLVGDVGATAQFRCLVRNDCGMSISDVATLLLIVSPVMGDVNDDGSVDGKDIQPFVAMFEDSGPLSASFCAADMNSDGVLTAADITAFVILLLSL